MTIKYIKYTQPFPWFRNKGLLVLAFVFALTVAFAFATRTQAAETGNVPTASTDNTATAACTIAAPSLNLSPGNQNAEAGANLEYTVSLTNNDNHPCSPSRFDLTVTYLPDGWTGDLSTNTLSLMPGATGTATLSVSPANDTPADSYNLQVAVSDAQKTTHAKAAIATYAPNDAATVVDDGATLTVVAGETSNPVNLSFSPEPDNVGATGDGATLDGVTIPASSGASAAKSGNAGNADLLTQHLTGLLTAYNKASGNAKSNALNELVAAAKERHALLAGLIASDPGAVLRVAVPTQIRDSMPAEVRTFIEQHLDLEGELGVLYEDYEDGYARLHHFLKTDGERISLHFEAVPQGLLSGTPVSANGVLLDEAMALESGESILTLAAGGGKSGGSNGGTAAAAPNTFGDQKTLLLLVNFQDNPTEPYTATYAQSVVFGTVSDFFRENSYGQTWLSGDVYGWLTIALDSTVCDWHTLANQADTAAEAAGAYLSNYTHIVYAFQNACTGLGIGTVGGNPSQAWIMGDLDVQVIAHELGHGLGLLHSHALDCGSTTLGDSCTLFEYGDRFDSMGNEHNTAHFSAFQKEQLGWLNNDVFPAITTVSTSGTYTVAPLETSDMRTKALKILKSTDATTGQRTWYYLEWRQASGFDAFLADNTNVLNGVLVHTGTEGDADSSDLLDLTPASGILNVQDWADPALAVGDSFEDPDAGVTLRSEWVSDSEAAVTVFIGSASTDQPPDQPADQPTDQPSITVSTDYPSYSPNQWVFVTTKVTSGEAAVANAAVSFTVTKSDGNAITGTSITGPDGVATYKLRIKKQDPVGNYHADTITTINTMAASASTDFTVQ